MSKPEEVLSCERFMSDIAPFILPTDQGKWAFFYYSVTSEEFVITVNYDKEKLEHKIGEYVPDIIKEAQKKVICTGEIGLSIGLCVRKLKTLAVTFSILLL